MSILSFIKKVCVQTAVYWGNPSSDGFGKFNYAEPIEIFVRWDEKSKLITLKNGENYISKAEVLVQQDLTLGGYLYLGFLSDLESNPINPITVLGSYKIIGFDKTPLIKSATKFVRTAYL